MDATKRLIHMVEQILESRDLPKELARIVMDFIPFNHWAPLSSIYGSGRFSAPIFRRDPVPVARNYFHDSENPWRRLRVATREADDAKRGVRGHYSGLKYPMNTYFERPGWMKKSWGRIQ